MGMRSEHSGVAKISFTGSTATGQKIAMAAAKNGKGTCMELGGKSALIVFEDANIEHAVEWAMVRRAYSGCSGMLALLLHALPST